jgi:hypothetical protein
VALHHARNEQQFDKRVKKYMKILTDVEGKDKAVVEEETGEQIKFWHLLFPWSRT